VNAIGSTAREYGNGDITSALHRGKESVEKGIIRKMQTASVRVIKQADLLKCPFAIIAPEHYRADGTCRCDDVEHQNFMKRNWGYTDKDFATKGAARAD
jgi:hypothetical protein